MKSINIPKRVLVSVLLGCLATYCIVESNKKSTDAIKAQYKTIPIVFATKDIPENTIITDGMLAIRRLPTDFALTNAVVSKNDAIGKVSRLTIIKGDQLSMAKLGGKSDPETRYLDIPQGMRAVTVTPDDSGYALQLMKTGDFVDVFVDYDDGDEHKSLVFDNVNILRLIGIKNDDVDVPLYSVTLALSMEQSEVVAKADQFGAIRLLHRPKNAIHERNKAITQKELKLPKDPETKKTQAKAITKKVTQEPKPIVRNTSSIPRPDPIVEVIRGTDS